MIVNSDQNVGVDIAGYLYVMREHYPDGRQIMTMPSNGPKRSFKGISDQDRVSVVIERVVTSDEATTSVYNFRCGRSSCELPILRSTGLQSARTLSRRSWDSCNADAGWKRIPEIARRE